MAKETIIIRGVGGRRLALNKIVGLNIEKPWVLTIERETKRRTLSQKALMWSWIEGVVKHVHEYTGHDKDEIHEWFKSKFAPVRIVDMHGEAVEYRSTKNFNTRTKNSP